MSRRSKRLLAAAVVVLLLPASATAAAHAVSDMSSDRSGVKPEPPVSPWRRLSDIASRSGRVCFRPTDLGTCSGRAETSGLPSSLVRLPQSCRTLGYPAPTGELQVVDGEADIAGKGRVIRFRVEAERGLAMDGACFARAVESVLRDSRSWIGAGRYRFERVDSGPYDFRVILASPDTVDALCRPVRTGGEFSCARLDRVVINAWRWTEGAESFGGDLVNYRRYLINHEVGHFLGHGHAYCSNDGDPAPVMMQQTKTVGECAPNAWPFPNG